MAQQLTKAAAGGDISWRTCVIYHRDKIYNIVQVLVIFVPVMSPCGDHTWYQRVHCVVPILSDRPNNHHQLNRSMTMISAATALDHAHGLGLPPPPPQ